MIQKTQGAPRASGKNEMKEVNVMISQAEVMTLLSDHEKAIGGLYQEFSRAFPEHKAFWSGCAEEEGHHAEILRSMQELVARKAARFTGRFNEAAIHTSLKYVQGQTAQAGEGRISLKQAYSIALNIETSLLENRYFEIISTDTDESKYLIKTLLEETRKHKDMIRDALAGLREHPK